MLRQKIIQWIHRYTDLPVMGLDISERTVKYFQISGGKHFEIGSFGELEIPEGVVVNGEIMQEDALVGILQQWLRAERLARASFFAVSLPEEKSFLRFMQLPHLKRADITNAIRWEIEANIPLKSDEISYAYDLIEPPVPSGADDHQDHSDVVVTAFPKEIVQSYVRTLRRGGLRLASLELESQAMLRVIMPLLDPSGGSIIIDIGRSRTTLIIFVSGAIIFTTTIALGGALLEENLMKALRVDEKEAARVKKEIGLDKRAFGGEAFAALAPSIAALADEARRTIDYYQDHAIDRRHLNAPIGQVVLVGGDANLLGLDTYLAAALRLPIMHANPFTSFQDRLTTAVPPIHKANALGFATAIGLALRGNALPTIADEKSAH